MELVFYMPVAADPGGQGDGIGVAVAGDEVHDFDGLLAFLRDRASELRDLGSAGEPDPGRRQHGLDGAPGPAAVAGAHGRDSGDRGPGQLLELLIQGGLFSQSIEVEGCDG